MRPLFVLQEQKESVRAIVPRSTVRQLIAGRPVTGRDRDESAIADQVDQNFHPHRHDNTLPLRRRRKGSVRFCAFRRSDPRDRMAVAVPPGSVCFRTKNPAGIEDADGVFHAFTSRKVAALESLTSWRRRRSGGLKVFAQWLIDYRWTQMAGAGGVFGSASTPGRMASRSVDRVS